MNLANLLSQHLFRHYDKTGNANVFVVLRKRHYDSLVEMLETRLVSRRRDAESIANETFDIVRDTFREFDDTKPFTDWLYRIAAHCAMQYTVKKRRRLSREFVAKVAALPEIQRNLLTTLFLDKTPYSLAAKRLGITRAELNTVLKAALTKLKCEWQPC
jgi:DNA-directed RNA polymerase specialized sigma24 family protein